MISPSYLDRLKRVVPRIIQEETHYSDLQNALRELMELCLEMTGLDFETENNTTRNHIFLDSGKAIGTKSAGECINDIMRTKRFTRGICKAVEKTRATQESGPIQLLYTGTGPFATLILPLLTLYTPKEIQLTLVEVNPLSLENCKEVLKCLNAEAYVSEFLNLDASTMQLENPREFDIVIVECLQHALNKEPQVAITHNVMLQCKEDVVLIPQEISLQVSLIDVVKEFKQLMDTGKRGGENFFMHNKTVFVLNKERMRSFDVSLPLDFKFPQVAVPLSEYVPQSANAIAVTTEIHVFGEERLGYKESGLTIPMVLKQLQPGLSIKEIITQYELGNAPALRTQCIY
ncbi:hypothetical protein POV27_10740 [Aureisphaera galaxeae]|uniref:hypothetical protein n=1 Tax=Aureisphaera galaxeae TaxID=1538023 RepID=UPI0023503222|nr:hypothetical protein [Aureisphaera galaxeae]MDC8004525.1 hypothetical protein [Aureisphaera galaxeae]